MRSMRKSLALLLALAMVLTTFAVATVSAQTFSDTQNHWAESVISKWSGDGVINGYEDGTFRPDNNITRAELAKIIATAKGYTAEADIAFADVAGDEWFASDLKKCVAQSVIGGYEDGTFKPDDYITREEAATMFARAYNINATALLNFTDNADISAWAQNSITALVGANVIGGYSDGSFMPKNPITRAEVVKILDGADSAEVLFPQATSFTGGTNSVGTIGNLGSGSTNTGGGSSSSGSSSGGYRTVKVTFNANGGSFDSGSETQTLSLSSGSAIGVKAPTATRDGYSFAGWYKTSAAAESIDDTKIWTVTNTVTSSMTLYAGWYIDGDVSVTFELNGGTGDIPTQTVASGSAVTAPATVPTRANYEFTGWYTDNTMKNAYDFSAAVMKNITLYAGWALLDSYEGIEITMPDETDSEKNLQTGTIAAIPPKAIAGETVKLIITPPDGFEVDGINSITYVGTVTDGDSTSEETLSVESSAITYDSANSACSFVIPENAVGDFKVAPQFNKMMPTPPPTATPKPTDPPIKAPTYHFAAAAFDEITTLEANKEVGGITVSKASSLASSEKDFDTYSYTKVLKIGTASLSFAVTGSCYINVDAVSANSSANREYEVFADTESLGTFVCEGSVTNTGYFAYRGSTAATIKIVPKEGINVYGIDVIYESNIPDPTPDPGIEYNISTAASANGSIAVSSETAKAGDTITVNTTPNAGYKTVDVTTEPAVTVTKVSDNQYTFVMPTSDVAVGASFVGESAQEYTVTAEKPEHGSISLSKGVDAAASDELINSSENFLVADGGKWIVSSDGTVGSTVVSDKTNIGGNSTDKLKLTDKAVQYPLSEKLTSGDFTLTYDFYDDDTSDAGRSFRTYLDNTAHAVSGAQATEMGTNGAIFHMMDVGSKVYVTNMETDVAGKTEAGTQVGSAALEASKWYRVEITGNLDSGSLHVAFYLHGTNGQYNPDAISATPALSGDVSFTEGRTREIAQVKFMRTASGNLYYDNIVLTAGAAIKTLKAYDGETVVVGTTPDSGYALDKIEAVQTDGTAVEVNGNTFVMPASDVNVTVTFIDESLKPTEAPTPTPDPAKTTTWTYSSDQDGCAANTELLPGLTTLFDDKADGKNYLTCDTNGSLSGGVATGTALKFVSPSNGTISVSITGLGSTKSAYIVEEGGSQDSPLAKYENTTSDKQNITISANTEAGKTYYIYGAGTKACFSSAMFVAQ